MENKDYFIIFLIVALISFILYGFRYEFKIVSRPASNCSTASTCPPQSTCSPSNECPEPEIVLDCKFLTRQAFDWPTISNEELIGTWEDKTTKQKFIFNSDGRIENIRKIDNIKRSYGFYVSTSYIIERNSGRDILTKLFYNSTNNTLYLTYPPMQRLKFLNKEDTRKYKNLPQINDVPYGSVWKWGDKNLLVITKNSIYSLGLAEDNTFIKMRVIDYETEEGEDEKGNKFYIFSSTIADGIMGTKLLYHKTQDGNKLDVISATLDKL